MWRTNICAQQGYRGLISFLQYKARLYKDGHAQCHIELYHHIWHLVQKAIQIIILYISHRHTQTDTDQASDFVVITSPRHVARGYAAAGSARTNTVNRQRKISGGAGKQRSIPIITTSWVNQIYRLVNQIYL